jgi:transposase InsO family protein
MSRRRPTGGQHPRPIAGSACSPPTLGTPDRLGAADISTVSTRERWLYLAIVLDAFSRRVVSLAVAVVSAPS